MGGRLGRAVLGGRCRVDGVREEVRKASCVDISSKEAVGLEEFSRRGVFVGRLVLQQYFVEL